MIESANANKPKLNWLLITSLIWVASQIFAACFSQYLSSYDPSYININKILSPPSFEHWLGTDQLGRDVMSRLIYGARISLSVGFVAVGISTFIGILVGAISAYAGGKLDRILMSLVDIMLCFPVFFLILSVIAIIDRPGIFPIMIIIGLTSWMGTARLIRAEILSLKHREFVLSAKAMGATSSHILLRHLIPNALSPVWVTMTLGIATAVLTESSLSFLGIGVQPPTPSWGNVLMDGKASLGVAWWLMLFPGLMILFTVLSYNIIGEFLRDRLQVQKRGL